MLIKSVAYATEILQILKKIKQISCFATLKSRTDYTDYTDLDIDRFQYYGTKIHRLVASLLDFTDYNVKHNCKSLLYELTLKKTLPKGRSTTGY